MQIPATARPGFEVEFEVAVVLGHFDQVTESCVAQRSAAEIGVKNNAGGIDHRAKRVSPFRCESIGNSSAGSRSTLRSRLISVCCPDAIPLRRSARALRAADSSAWRGWAIKQGLARGQQEQIVDRRQLPKEPVVCFVPMLKVLNCHGGKIACERNSSSQNDGGCPSAWRGRPCNAADDGRRKFRCFAGRRAAPVRLHEATEMSRPPDVCGS